MFKRVSTPADIIRSQLNGSPVEKGFGSWSDVRGQGEAYVQDGGSGGMRQRDKSLELASEFKTVMPRDSYAPSPHQYKVRGLLEEGQRLKQKREDARTQGEKQLTIRPPSLPPA
jgi:hypothetical protein